MRKILSILAALLCAAACIYPYDFDLDENSDLKASLAVDGNITIGAESTVLLGSVYPLKGVSGIQDATVFDFAKVWVEDDAGNVYMGKKSAKNLAPYAWGYASFTIPTENAPADRRYRLCVDALGATYSSDWSDIPAPPVIRDIKFVADDNNVNVCVSVDGGESGTGYFLLSYDETWEFHSDYVPHYDVDTRFWRITEGDYDYSRYWCWKSVDTGRSYPVDYTGRTEQGVTDWMLLGFSRRDNRNHRRYCINVKAKNLSSTSYRFLKNLEDNTGGGDNLFTPNPGEIPSNIRCDSNPDRMVYGYAVFGRSVSKRAFLDSRYLKAYPLYSLIYFPTAREYKETCEFYWSQGFKPLKENPKQDYDPEEEGPYGWGPPECYDCIAAGGTQVRPDFWNEGL